MNQILLAVRPRLWRETLRMRLADEPDVAVVGEVDDDLDLLLAVRATKANVVIHSWPDQEMPPVYTHLLNEFPGLAVLGVGAAGEAMLCEQRITVTPLSSGNIDELLLALRTGKAAREQARV